MRALLIAGLLGFVLFAPPQVGMANNGDFGKLSLRYKLWAPHELEFVHAADTYQIRDDKQWDSGFRSTEDIFLTIATKLNPSAKTFDMRWIGLLHGAVYLGAFLLLMPLLKSWWRFGLVALFFADVWHLAYFESFYMDTPAQLGLFLAAAAALRRNWLLFLVGALLLVFSKAQHYPLAIPFAALLAWRGGVRMWLPAAGLVAGAAYAFAHIPDDYMPITSFNMVFYKLLPISPQPDKDIYELGFNESFKKYIGTHTYSKGNLMDDLQFRKEVGWRAPTSKVAKFMLTHPRMIWEITIDHLGQAGYTRVENLGNYDPSSGHPAGAHSYTMSAWSSLRRFLYGDRGLLYLLVWVALLIALIARAGAYRAEAIALAAASIIAYGVGGLGDGLEVTRHLYLFNIMVDMALAAVIVQYAPTSLRPPA